MNRFSRHTGNVISALALLLVSSYAYAVDCPGGSNFYYSATGSVTPTTTTINVAVASNFKDAAKDLANGYVAGTSYKVNLCQGSSGTISSSINGGNPYNIALFLSADQSFADAVTVALGSSFPYANGVPVFFAVAQCLRFPCCGGLFCDRANAWRYGRWSDIIRDP